MPHVEQDNVGKIYNFSRPWYGDPINVTAAANRLKILMCPADPNAAGNGSPMAWSNYHGNAGVWNDRSTARCGLVGDIRYSDDAESVA